MASFDPTIDISVISQFGFVLVNGSSLNVSMLVTSVLKVILGIVIVVDLMPHINWKFNR